MATYELLQALRPFSEIVGSNQYVFLEVGKGPHMSTAIITNGPPIGMFDREARNLDAILDTPKCPLDEQLWRLDSASFLNSQFAA